MHVYLLCTYILLFSTVNAYGDSFVRSVSYISSKNRLMMVCLHVKPRSSSSVTIVQQKGKGFIVIIITIIQCSLSHSQLQPLTRMGNKARKVSSIENDFDTSPYLQLQCWDNTDTARVWLRQTAFRRNLYEVSMESNCT